MPVCELPTLAFANTPDPTGVSLSERACRARCSRPTVGRCVVDRTHLVDGINHLELASSVVEGRVQDFGVIRTVTGLELVALTRTIEPLFVAVPPVTFTS